LLPGTAFTDLALHAAGHTDTPTLEELTLEAPLVLRPDGTVTLHVTVGPPAADGSRPLTIHSRRDESATWTRHASGALTDADPAPETATTSTPRSPCPKASTPPGTPCTPHSSTPPSTRGRGR
ncbi:polyketide synthase dehydratase domain-containing protein, partial [Streptomyces atroolivaceus]|uniref:polyketide synthase dehydratase domain-containing protein n=1 Tax=Streptomyces atroolivaceus TaxID=66869 RepID=UPI003134412D